MKELLPPAPVPSGRDAAVGSRAGGGWARALVHRRLRALRTGRLRLRNAAREETEFGDPASQWPPVRIDVHRRRFYRRALLGGSLGVAESYMDGDWSASDLTALIRMFVRDLGITDAMEGGLAAVAGGLARLGDLARRNTRAGSRRNIHAHYDLGNDFFALFLDETLTYSAGIFERPDATMADASRAKLDRICRKLALAPGDRVVEIGSGWGSFALHAARHYGCHVTTTTISREQHAFVTRLVGEHGLTDRIRVLCSDYRDLPRCALPGPGLEARGPGGGRFDKLVSIEMIEAVGHAHLPRYFSVCERLLHEGGEALVQAIVMPEPRYRRYRRQSDFIRRYVFPGSCVPSLGAILAAATGTGAFRAVHMEDIGPHYAETLRRWRDAFETRLDAVRGLGFDERFIRLWRFYLAYCEAGFEERYLGDVQLLLRKPGCHAPPMPGRLAHPLANPGREEVGSCLPGSPDDNGTGADRGVRTDPTESPRPLRPRPPAASPPAMPTPSMAVESQPRPEAGEPLGPGGIR